MKRISMKRRREMEEHDARIAQLMNEPHEYARRHGYSDVDLYDVAYAFTVETLSLLSKKDIKIHDYPQDTPSGTKFDAH